MVWWGILNVLLELRNRIHLRKVLVDRVDESVVITIVVDNDEEADTLHQALQELINKYGDMLEPN
jgi:hypothetical protein